MSDTYIHTSGNLPLSSGELASLPLRPLTEVQELAKKPIAVETVKKDETWKELACGSVGI
jgi:hypothetical protein